jgi:hypothetical protein
MFMNLMNKTKSRIPFLYLHSMFNQLENIKYRLLELKSKLISHEAINNGCINETQILKTANEQLRSQVSSLNNIMETQNR